MRYIFNILKYNENKFPYLNVGMGLAPPRPGPARLDPRLTLSLPYSIPIQFEFEIREIYRIGNENREMYINYHI